MLELDWKNPKLKTAGALDANKALKIAVPDGSVVSNAASIRFTGRGAANYGEIHQENLMRVVENFADTTEPLHPTVGQTWYDAQFGTLMVCINTLPVPQWKEVGGIIITEVGIVGPQAVKPGQLWYQKTGPLTGILHVSSMSGRYPSDGKTLGGWEQIHPPIETAGGRDEYDYVFELVNKLIDVAHLGSGARISILKVINNFEILDGELHIKYNATPDPNLLKIGELVEQLRMSPNSQDWDQLLAGARYAINRLEVPHLLPDEISPQPFVQDGRIVNPTLTALDPDDIRYPAIERLANRRAGLVSLVRFYASTINALKIAIHNRYSIRGINDSKFGPLTRVKPHITFSGSQAGHGTLSVMKMRFSFLNKDYLERFLYHGGAIQLVISHAYNGTSPADSVFKELFDTKGAFRISNDDTRTLSGSPLEVVGITSKAGFSSRNLGGALVATESLSGSSVSIKVFSVSERQFAVEASCKATDDLVGATTFKFSVIHDIEVFTDATGSVRVYTEPDGYLVGDEDGTSPWFEPGDTTPDPEFPPRGVLVSTKCECNDKIGIYTDGKGGTYAELIQANSPECLDDIPCEGELKSGGSILIPGEATGITLIGRGAPGSTVHGGTEYFYTGKNGNNSVIFKGNAIVYGEVAQGGNETYNAKPGEKITAMVSLTYRTNAQSTNSTIPVTVTGSAGSNGTLTLTGNANIPSPTGSPDTVITVSKVITFSRTGPGASSVRAGADTTTMLDTVEIKTFPGSADLSTPVDQTFTTRFTANAGGRVLSFLVPPLGKLRYTFCAFLPPKCEARGRLISSDCVGTSMVGTYTDGACGTYTATIKANSPDCIVCAPRGGLISSACVGTSMVGTYTDGACGTYTATILANSPACGPCNGTAPASGNSVIQVPAGVTAVDFVGKGGPGASVTGGVTGYKYRQKGPAYLVSKGGLITNIVLGSPADTIFVGNVNRDVTTSIPTTFTTLPGSLIDDAGDKTSNVFVRGRLTGDPIITLKGSRGVPVFSPPNPAKSDPIKFNVEVQYELIETLYDSATNTPGLNTTATIQGTTQTFPGSPNASPAGTVSKSISILSNTSGVELKVYVPPGGSLAYNWCSHKS